MDKNTILGMLLMGAVILGFMYLNKPSAEEQARLERERQEQLANAAAQSQSTDNLAIDSVSPTEISAIKSTVSTLGIADSASGAHTLESGNVKINLAADGTLSGSIDVDSTAVALSSILSASYDGIPAPVASRAVADLKKAIADAARYRGFARHLHGDSSTVTIKNRDITLEISNKGGVISRASLNNYRTYDSLQVTPIAPGNDSYGFILTSANQRFDTREFFFTPLEVTDSTVLMNLDLGDGASWGIRYTIDPQGGYLVKMEILQNGMQVIIPTSVNTMDFVWNQRMARNEKGIVFEQRNSALYYMFANGDVDNLNESGDDQEELNERLKWIGYKNQFFSSVIIPDENFAAANISSQELKDNKNELKLLTTEATLDYSSTLATPASFTLFLGPNSYPLLSDLQDEIDPDTDLHLTKLIPLGWSLFRWINTWIIIPVFNLLGSHIASYGIIILILTILIKIILFPFTYKSYISQAKMRVLAPDIKALNEKYPGKENAMKRQQETMALYSRAGASPFSGCLPMLLQMPILIAMFNFFPSAIELRGESFLWANDLSAPDAIISWNTDIPFISSTFGNHISLFCLLMTVVNILYTRINMQNTPSNDSMPGMKWMMYLMPVMFLVFFNNYAAGLSYYYFLSLLITIAQTYIFRRVINEDKVRATMRENAKKPKKKSGFMARLEEAQRQQQAMLREQEKRKKRR